MKARGKKGYGQTGKPPAMRVLSILLAFALSQFYLVLPASAQTTAYSVTGTAKEKMREELETAVHFLREKVFPKVRQLYCL